MVIHANCPCICHGDHTLSDEKTLHGTYCQVLMIHRLIYPIFLRVGCDLLGIKTNLGKGGTNEFNFVDVMDHHVESDRDYEQ